MLLTTPLAYIGQAQSIVSLVPSQTELLYHLGLNDTVTGITKFCIHPPQWFRNKIRVGGTKNIDFQKIKDLAPDLIIANKEENTREQIAALAADCPVWVTDVNNLAEALQMIKDIGLLTRLQDTAQNLCNDIAHAFAAISKNNPPATVAYLIWQDPFMTVGGDTFINDMLLHAGFINIFSSSNRYPVIESKQLQALKPQYIFLSSEPYPFQQKHLEQWQPLFPDSKIVLVDGEMFSWYGSRLLLAPAYFDDLNHRLP